MAFDERDRSLSALYYILILVDAVFHQSLALAGFFFSLADYSGSFAEDLFPDYNVIALPNGNTDNEAENNLGDKFSFLAEAFLIVLEYFDIVVGEAEGSAPESAENQKQHIYIGKVAEEEYS